MKFEIRGRRSDASNYVAMKINAANSTIQLVEKIAGVESVLTTANYVFHSDILVLYECGLWIMDEHIYARINGAEIVRTTTSVPKTAHGMSLYVPEVFDEDPVAFSHVAVKETTEHELPSLNNDNLLVMFRDMVKNNIECPNHRDWETFKRAKKLYERFKDLGYSDETWTNFGFPLEKPQAETWFGGD